MTTHLRTGGAPIARVSRRAVLGGALGLAGTVLLAGCGEASPADGAASSATRRVATAKGTLEIPATPRRIVSVHSWTTESLLDLGRKPVGVEDSGEQYVPSRYLSRWRPVPKVAQGATIDFEKIASLRPDLIVGVNVPYLASAYPKLKEIAPTAFAPFDEAATWQTYPRYTADFVDAGAALSALEAKYSAAIARTRKEYAEPLARVSWDIIQGGFDAGDYWIYSGTSSVGDVLSRLGARFAAATRGTEAGQTRAVSYERTDLLEDAGQIIYYTDNDGSPANDIGRLFALPGYRQLPAVRAGHVVGTPDFLPGSYSDALGLLDSIRSALAKL